MNSSGRDMEALLRGGGTKGPPKDIPPSELILKLQDSRRPSEVLPFVRKDEDGNPLCQYRMMVLTPEELSVARANADQYTRTKLTETLDITDEQARQVRRETWADIYNDALMVEALYEAMRREDDCRRRLWDAPSQMRKWLTTDEVAQLFAVYQGVQFRLGPTWSLLTDEEVTQWIDALTAGAGAFPLESLGQGQLVQLAISLAYRLRDLRTGTGSSGSPSDGATSASTDSLPHQSTSGEVAKSE